MKNINNFTKERSSLIPILIEIQKTFGYLPEKYLSDISKYLNLTKSEILGVATFYKMFKFIPPAKNRIRLCLGTACYVNGGRLIYEYLKKELDIDLGEVDKSNNFSLDKVACLGCCSLSPVILINDKLHTKMNINKVERILGCL